ncbi:MAG TPA: VC0807 family protein [Acidimicrobiia bacterium]|nr:VC0807 family protein [Acidimicrobiia bacterium]HMF84028.1 VC0807 family protein [Acidimicrobiia bacterium]
MSTRLEIPHFEIPRLRTLARHAAPHVVEGTIVPLALFLLTLRFLGVWGAVLIGLGWTYAAVARRLVMGQRVPGILVLTAVTLTARTIIAMVSGSVVVYFLQPTLGTALVAGAFLLSVPLGRPLAERLARDFCPIPSGVLAHAPVRRFFLQISLLWAFTQLANATVTLWLLLSQSLATFLVARTLVSWGLTGGAIVVSTLWFRRSMRRHGILAPRPATPTAPATPSVA